MTGNSSRAEFIAIRPIQAADDGLREFPADEVVFVTGDGDENWLEQGIVEAARERYEVRVTHIEGS